MLLLFLLATLFLYAYLVQHAESLFSDFVKYETKGNIELDIKKLRFNFTELRLTLIETRMFTVDTLKSVASYHVKADTIVLELAALRPLLFGKQLKIDSILIKKPQINVVKRRKSGNDTFNLPQQMDLSYRSLETALNQFSVKYCLIDSGKFKLTDLTLPGSKPLQVTDYYLMIDHMQKDKFNGQRFLFADKVKFYSSRQKITSLDGKHQLQFSRLRINSYRRLIELDSCYIFSQQAPGSFNKFSGYFDTLRFTNVDFIHLVEKNTLQADSVYCINPSVDISTIIKEKAIRADKMKMLKNKDSLVAAIKSLMGNFRLKYIGVDNGSVRLVTKKGARTSSYSLQKSDFALQEVVVVDRPKIPLRIGRFDLGLMGYQAIDPDSSYVVRFDSIRLMNDHVYLSNFSLQPYLNNKQGSGIRQLKAKALVVNDVQWDELFASRKIVAASVGLMQPEVEMITDNAKEQPKNKKNLFRLFHSIAPFSSIDELFVKDANISIKNHRNQNFRFKGLFAELKVNGFLQSASFEDLGKSIKDLSFRQADIRLHSGQLTLNDGYIRGTDKMLWIKKLDLENESGSLLFSFENLSVNELASFSKGKIIVGDLYWKKASLTASVLNKKKDADSAAAPIEISIKHISGAQTNINIDNNKMLVNADLTAVEINDFFWNSAHAPLFTQASVHGNHFNFKRNELNLSSVDFEFNTQLPSYINQFRLVLPSNKGQLRIQSPTFAFTPVLSDFQKTPLEINNCVLNNPLISWEQFDRQSNAASSDNTAFPSLSINQFSLLQPKMILSGSERASQFKLDSLNMELNIRSLRSHPDSGVACKDVRLIANNFTFQNGKKSISLADTSRLNIELPSLTLKSLGKNHTPAIHTKIESMTVSGLNMMDVDSAGESKSLQLHSLILKNFNLPDLLHLSKENLFADNPFELKQLSLSMTNKNSALKLLNLHSENENSVSFDSLVYHPSASFESYFKNLNYQKDYLSLNVGSSKLVGLDKSLLILNGQLVVDTIMTNNARLEIFKDKRLPFLKGLNKQLPVGMIQKIPLPMRINKCYFTNAFIGYKELNDKNNRIGMVDFSGMQLVVAGMNNLENNQQDSLRMQASGFFMDQAPIRFRYAQSYTDPLGGFSLGIRFRPFELQQFNAALEPLAGAAVVSGKLDTIRLNAIGTDSMAHGKMKMYYKGLKIRYTGIGGDSVRNFKSRLITFLANDFILKRNNNKGYGIVYTSRDKERSFANYWMRIGLSGVMSSSGVKSNKKQERQYRKQVEQMKIPELPEIEL